MNDNVGANTNAARLELLGKVVPLTNNFKSTAKTCGTPTKPFMSRDLFFFK